MGILRALAVSSALLMLCACAGRQTPIGNGLPQDGVWALKGKLAVDSGADRGSFSVTWRQDRDAFDINLFGALGVGVAHVSGDASGARLEVSGRPALEADTADDLLRRAIGLDLPVGPMKYWVRGQPAPGEHTTTDHGLQQMGWSIEYLSYTGDLPKKIRLTRPEATVTMVVTEWRD